jgi:hypothetical protein
MDKMMYRVWLSETSCQAMNLLSERAKERGLVITGTMRPRGKSFSYSVLGEIGDLEALADSMYMMADGAQPTFRYRSALKLDAFRIFIDLAAQTKGG